MNKKFSKLSIFILMFCIALTGVITNPVTAKATETIDLYTSSETGTLYAESGYSHLFEFDAPGTYRVKLCVVLKNKVSFTVGYKPHGNLDGYAIQSISASDSEWQEFSNEMNIVFIDLGALPEDTYSVYVMFDDETDFWIYVSATAGIVEPAPIIPIVKEKSVTITAGFSDILDASEDGVKWLSSNTSIVSVNSQGKIIGKKAGKAVVTATMKNGNQVIYNVTVKNNKYTEKKADVDDVAHGSVAIQVYNASYDKSGNLVLKTRIVNNTSYTIVNLKNVKLTVKDKNGKVVGTCKVTNKKVLVSEYSNANYSFKIKKADVKKKNVDLRLAKIAYTGTYEYYLY
ncbi:SLAP domain-containing protein [Lachnospiraceae bacterium 47-T17]